MREFMRVMMGNQQEQMRMMMASLAANNQAATAAVDRATAPREPRTGSIADFRRLSPREFTGTEEPLAAEQWLTDMVNLLEGANIPAVDQVKVVKVQLTDVARSWWLAEEMNIEGPVTWKQFSDRFLERFFPKDARRQMQKQFMNLKQWDRSVDIYAAEFIRLSRFAPLLVADEEEKANHFRQGLKHEIQKLMASQPMDTYSQVLTAARRVELELGIDNRAQQKQGKRPFNQVGQGQNQPAKRPFQQSQQQQQQQQPKVECSYCHRLGHTRQECRRANGSCLACGSKDHQLSECPIKNNRNNQPVPPALPALPVRRNQAPVGRGAPLPPQQ
jgi:hypothetical protein